MNNIKDFFTRSLDEEDVLQNNEIQANKLAGFTMFCGSFLLAIVWILCRTGVFVIKPEIIDGVVIQGILELLIPAVICRCLKGRKMWLKYVMLMELVIVLARIDSVLGYNVTLIMVIPVILSCRFFSRRFTVLISGMTAVLFAASSFANAWWDLGYLDLNFYDPPAGTTLEIQNTIRNAIGVVGIDRSIRVEQVLTLSLLPRLLIYILIAVICVKIADKGRKMVIHQEQITRKTARIESELDLANNIQSHMLPTIFPPYPECEEVDLYASMDPAKEVGGDFYDFYMLDDHNLAMIVADVSGKGVPAALFMVIAKTLIKNEANMGAQPGEIFTRVNHMLCEGNDYNMFVTAWMGILNTETGVLTYANAGHNPPLIRLSSEKYKYLKVKPGFVLAGIDGLQYKQYELQLEPEDCLFVYTDGVTEATDQQGNLYGEKRLEGYLNQHSGTDITELLKGLRKDIGQFAGEAEQFDDITMLMMHYRKKKKTEQMQEKNFPAELEQLPEVMAFVEKELERAECSSKVSMEVSVCVEEIFVNIARYAYGDKSGDVTVGVKYREGELVLRFADHGIPFDPTVRKKPDTESSAEDREIGGLGIYIVKQTMDEVQYEYQNGMNILTVKKNLTEVSGDNV